ncbi:unnamed protein product, partial [Owenia fusiformis]
MKKSTHFYIYTLVLLLIIKHGNTTQKTKIYKRIPYQSRTDSVTETISVGSVGECAFRCLLNEGVCKSYNLRTNGGSGDMMCEFIGMMFGGNVVASPTIDHYYPDQG